MLDTFCSNSVWWSKPPTNTFENPNLTKEEADHDTSSQQQQTCRDQMPATVCDDGGVAAKEEPIAPPPESCYIMTTRLGMEGEEEWKDRNDGGLCERRRG